MFKYFSRQPFWVNLVAAIVLVCLLIFLFLQSLSWFTNHGSYLKVPAVAGKKTDDAVRYLQAQGFEVVITDSVYHDSLPLNTVVKQLPDSGSTVKVNRTVFLIVNPQTLPMVEMPKLIGLSFRFALERLSKNHLLLGDTTYKPDFMKGTILGQTINGNNVEAGAKLKWGTAVDLVIGGGLVQMQIEVPNVYGLTLADAKAELDAKGITLAAVLPTGDITDTLKSYVIRQNPDVKNDEGQANFMQPGQTMDLWISATAPPADSLQEQKMPLDSPKINQ